MNHYPRWVYGLVLGIILLGAFIALPSLYGDSEAVQISLKDQPVDAGVQPRIEQALAGAGAAYDAMYDEDGKLVVRFDDADQQEAAIRVINQTLGNDYIVAQTFAPRAPDWLRKLGMRPMSLGLDLRGGVHLLLEVDMDSAISTYLERSESEFKRILRDADIPYRQVSADAEGVTITLRDPGDVDRAQREIRDENDEFDLRASTTSPAVVLATMSDATRKAREDFAIQQNTTTLRNRVNELGVAEPLVQRQGLDRILVQLPGVRDPGDAKELLKSTATVEFRLADEEGDPFAAQRTGRAPPGTRLYLERDGGPVLLKRDVIATGDQITDATSGYSEGSPAVFVKLDGKGGRRMLDTTKANLGKPMAVVFITEERETRTDSQGNETQRTKRTEEVISVANIRGVFSNSFQITGLTPAESQDLALLLRAGALAAPVYLVEERTVGPSLGKDNIEQGRNAIVIGFLLVVVFMLFYYRMFGVFANLALLVNVVMIVALLSLLQASLTLPGIAGIVLTVGMAVDANVLIFERIREELRNGNSPQAAIHAGYEKAFSSIFDANITTFIAAVVLFTFGTGPIKGFAITLSLGILTSMFTAIIGTRAIVNLLYGGRQLERLPI